MLSRTGGPFLKVLRLRIVFIEGRLAIISAVVCDADCGIGAGGGGGNNLDTGAMVIVGRLGRLEESKSVLRHETTSFSDEFGDGDRLLANCSGDAERLRQFFSHSSGVIKLPPLASLCIKCGFISRWACVSLMKICILY